MKNKITAILLATLMTLTVFAAFVTPVSAAGSQNSLVLTSAGSGNALIGQELNFTGIDYNATTVTIKGIADTATAGEYFTASVTRVGSPGDSDNYAVFDTSVMTKTGEYKVNYDGDYSLGTDYTLGVSSPTLTIDLKIGTTSVSSTTAGTVVTLKVTTNIGDTDNATIELIDPDGNKLAQDGELTNLKNIYMSEIKDFTLNTTGFKAGTYTIQVKTNSTAARGLSASSNIKSLEIVSPDITISASKTSVENDDIAHCTCR